MSLLVEERLSDSPYIEAVMHGHTVGAGSTIRPAESHWHMVFMREHGNFHPLVVGALTSSGVVAWGEGAEILWIKFKLGAFMPHLPANAFVDVETPLPGATRQSFWLKSAAWQCPDFDNVETFVNRLAREEILVRDPLVNAVLQEQPHDMAPRTLRHRFLRATGLTHCHIRQFERAQQAAALLRQGISILDTVYELGYFDQPHLTRSLKQFVGYTPAQILGLTAAPITEMSQPS
ncbi:MAG: AraC family transcriptional regulator [Chloroflexi bacterium]|nr:AraC family transcriptional regulator [Chloroflexota bacterium]